MSSLSGSTIPQATVAPKGKIILSGITEVTITPKKRTPNRIQYDRFYADTPENRLLGRVGLPLGSAPISKVTPSPQKISYQQNQTTVQWETKQVTTPQDYWAEQDRRQSQQSWQVQQSQQERWQPKQVTSVQDYWAEQDRRQAEKKSQKSYQQPQQSYQQQQGYQQNYQQPQQNYQQPQQSYQGYQQGYSTPTQQGRRNEVYADNYQNRRLGRVGMPVGSAVYSPYGTERQVKYYKDTPLNQKLGRVGMPIGY